MASSFEQLLNAEGLNFDPGLRALDEGLGRGPRAQESSNVCSAPYARIAGETGRENCRPSVPAREGGGERL